MRIFISNELLYIKEELKKRGYDIIEEKENRCCDAIICNLKNGGLVNLGINNNVRREGTLIIDSGSKTIEEIEYILDNRAYSNLF